MGWSELVFEFLISCDSVDDMHVDTTTSYDLCKVSCDPSQIISQNSRTPTSNIFDGCSCHCQENFEGTNCQTLTPCDAADITCSNGGLVTEHIKDNNCACQCPDFISELIVRHLSLVLIF